MASVLPFWEGRGVARTLEVLGGCEDPTTSALVDCRGCCVATAGTTLDSTAGSALTFLLVGLTVPGGARGFRGLFSLTSVAVEVPGLAAESRFFRGLFTAGGPLAVIAMVAAAAEASSVTES